jgi:hypothetical protein
MSNDNEFGKIFKFSLHQGDVLLCEKMIDSSDFSPEVRYPINIRHILPKAIGMFQKTLSKRYYETFAYVGEEKHYELFNYANDIIDSYDDDIRNDLIYDPSIVSYQIEDKVIKGVPCSIGFYVNGKTIVERTFYVNGFNPTCRYSVDVVDAVKSVTNEIYNHIKRCDLEFISKTFEAQSYADVY